VRHNPDTSNPQWYSSALGTLIQRNELDSNFAYDIWVQGADNVQLIGNRFLNHPYLWKQTGVGGNYPHCQVVLGFPSANSRAIVRNTYLRNNLSRSESTTHGIGDYETQMYCVDPHNVAQTKEELDTTFGPNTSNFSVLASGAGGTAVCNQAGGRVRSCKVLVGGWYPSGSVPSVNLVGPGCRGQSARAVLSQTPGNTWGWISSIEIENGGTGCTGDVWPVIGFIPYPATNRMQNEFRGYNPATVNNPSARFQILTAPSQ
jgi:hypothetical protein